ncbi:MAG: hypothetical protein QXN55_00950 [Candidatus Nitrosotenuis sp.]
MILQFRHGVLNAPQDNLGNFTSLRLSSDPTRVDLSTTNGPLLITIAHGSSNYVVEFNKSIPKAWGPLPINADLYIEISQITGLPSFTYSTLPFLVQHGVPPAPAIGQNVFDLDANVVKEWDGNRWITKLKVLVGSIAAHNINSYPAGSQIGVTGDFSGGFILADGDGKPIRKPNGELLTSDVDIKLAGSQQQSSIKVDSTIFLVTAIEPIPAFSVVAFGGPDQIKLAQNDINLGAPPVGFCVDPVYVNEASTIILSGRIIHNPNWNFDLADAGKTLYLTANGQFSTIRPQQDVWHVGSILNPTTILFQIDREASAPITASSAGITSVSAIAPITSNTTTGAVLIGLGEATVNQDGYMTAIQAQQLENTVNGLNAEIQTRDAQVQSLTSSLTIEIQSRTDADLLKADINHTHAVADVVSLQASLDNKADVNHVHGIADVTSLQAELDNKSNISHIHDWTNIINAPTTAAGWLTDVSLVGHQHHVIDIVDFPASWDWTNISNAPTTWQAYGITNVADISHSHHITDIIDFPATWDWANIVNHPTTLAGYGISPTELVHNHPWTDIVSTPTTLAGYGITDAALASHNHALASLTDIQFATVPANGDLLKFNDVSNKWENSSYAVSINVNLGGVAITTPIAGQVLTYDLSGSWVNANLPAFPTNWDWTNIVNTPTTLAGYSITDAVTTTTFNAHNHALSQLSDVVASTSTRIPGDVLKWDGTQWVNQQLPVQINTFPWSNITSKPTTISGFGITDAYTMSQIDSLISNKSNVGHIHSLAEASDVTIATPTATQYLVYNGTSWTNAPFPTTWAWANITGAPTTWAWANITGTPTTLNGYGITDTYTATQVDTLLSGKAATVHTHALSSLVETSIVAPNVDEFLKFNGTMWINSPLPTSVNWSNVTGTPTTLSGYGITDAVAASEKGSANGVATLDSNGKVPSIHLPAIAITDTFVAVDEASMLALAAQTGDVAIRTDLNKSFILKGTDPTLFTDWQELLTPTDIVLSVNGQIGAVTISDITGNAGTATSVLWSGVSNTPTTLSGYGITDAYTSAQVDTLLFDKANTSHTHALASLTDVNVGTLSVLNNNESLVFNGTTLKWEAGQKFLNLNGGIMAGNINVNYNVVDKAILKSYGEPTTNASTAATYNIDLSVSNTHVVTLTDNTVFTVSNFIPGAFTSSITLVLIQDATGGRTPIFPSNFKWAGGTLPTFTTTSGGTDVLTIISTDGGSSWLAFIAGIDMKILPLIAYWWLTTSASSWSLTGNDTITVPSGAGGGVALRAETDTQHNFFISSIQGVQPTALKFDFTLSTPYDGFSNLQQTITIATQNNTAVTTGNVNLDMSTGLNPGDTVGSVTVPLNWTGAPPSDGLMSITFVTQPFSWYSYSMKISGVGANIKFWQQ